MAGEIQKAQAALRELALGLPGATEEFPWGERVVKVDKKVFVFLGRDEPHSGWGMSVKLPQSGASALDQPYAEPTGYGLGKSGWVTLSFEPGDRPPLERLRGWILESYRAVAPKKRLAELDGAAPAKSARPVKGAKPARRAEPARRAKPARRASPAKAAKPAKARRKRSK